MDVDSPAGTLKRCSSAPMINDINNSSNMTTSPTSTSLRDNMPFNVFASNGQLTRNRRHSASFSPLPGSPTTGLRVPPRISQIRQEECADLCNQREVAHERDTHSAMQISQSWEDLTIVTESLSCKSDQELKPPLRDLGGTTKTTPLHVSLPPYASVCSSPSPTRPGIIGSPGFQSTFKTLSPSPTRKYTYMTRRSASPVLRPSPLGPIKRKLDDERTDLSPKTKKLNNFSDVRGGLLMAGQQQHHPHPHLPHHPHSSPAVMGGGRGGGTTMSSPLPGSLSSVGTPESLSSADSPGGFFRPVDSPSPSRPGQGSNDEPMLEETSSSGKSNASEEIAMVTADHHLHHGPS